MYCATRVVTTSQPAQTEHGQTGFGRQTFKAPAKLTSGNQERPINCRDCQFRQQTVYVWKRQVAGRVGSADLNQQTRPHTPQRVQLRAKVLLVGDAGAKFEYLVTLLFHRAIFGQGMDEDCPAGDHLAEDF